MRGMVGAAPPATRGRLGLQWSTDATRHCASAPWPTRRSSIAYAYYQNPSFNDDPNLSYLSQNPHANQYPLKRDTLLQLKEDPCTPGRYFGITTYGFGTRAAGQIQTINSAPTLNGDQVALNSITHPDTAFTPDTPSSNHSGLYRDLLPLSDGTLVAVYTAMRGV